MWLHPSWAFDWWPMDTRFMRNILFCNSAERTPTFVQNWGTDLSSLQRAVGQCDDNLYYHAKGQVLFGATKDKGNMTLRDWRETTGFDEHSVVADPMFVNAEADDYSLRPDCPVLKAGFHPIDIGKIGIRP
jgi:hypothetical protein